MLGTNGWFDTETGLEFPTEWATAVVKKKTWGQEKYLSFEFPSWIRDLKKKKVNNTFGDAAFIIMLKQDNATHSTTKSSGPLFRFVKRWKQ